MLYGLAVIVIFTYAIHLFINKNILKPNEQENISDELQTNIPLKNRIDKKINSSLIPNLNNDSMTEKLMTADDLLSKIDRDKETTDNEKEEELIENNIDNAIEENVTEKDSLLVKDNQKDQDTDTKTLNDNFQDEEKKELGKYHILYRDSDNKWYIKREGSDKVIRVLHTKKEAIAYATIKAINQDTNIVIHSQDGKIEKHGY